MPALMVNIDHLCKARDIRPLRFYAFDKNSVTLQAVSINRSEEFPAEDARAVNDVSLGASRESP